MKSKVYVLIFGKVQGVWFRVYTKNKAEQLNLTGWVRNTHDGNVEAVFEGDVRDVNDMIKWCNMGPPLARVKKVDVKSLTPSNNFDEFTIKY
jgi:acylphosphatase